MSAPSQTCGQGLAANSDLPARMSDVTAAVAAVLAKHMEALDRADPTNQAELDVYRRLPDGYGRAYAALAELARSKVDLVRLLRDGADGDRAMPARMRPAQRPDVASCRESYA